MARNLPAAPRSLSTDESVFTEFEQEVHFWAVQWPFTLSQYLMQHDHFYIPSAISLGDMHTKIHLSHPCSFKLRRNLDRLEHAASKHGCLGNYLQLAQRKHIYPLNPSLSKASRNMEIATHPMTNQPEFQITCIKSGASYFANLAIQHWQVGVGGSFINPGQ